MAEKQLRPRNPGAQVARAAGTRKSVAEANPGRKLQRYVLPSRRVLAVMTPNVGEFIDLRERAAIRASKDSEKPTQQEFGFHLGMLAMRRLVKGITLEPVPVMYVDGFDVEAARARATAAAEQAVAEYVDDLQARHARRRAGNEPLEERGRALDPVPSDEELPGIVHGYAERLLDDACFEAEDTDAMREAANVVPVTDFMWDAPDSYLNAIRSADIGTPEAADMLAIQDIIGSVFMQLAQAATGTSGRTAGPFAAATKPKTRPWR